MRRLRVLLQHLFRREELEHELDEELRSSFEIMVDRLTARGMPLDEAQRLARLEFEGLERVKQTVRDGWIGSGVHSFMQDVQHAWRGLRRRPSFACVALITLSLGIGVNTAVFSVFYSVLMRGLPYGHAGELVTIWGNFRTRSNANVAVTGEIFREIEQRQHSMSGVAGVWVTPPRTIPGDPPEQVKSAMVTSNFFDVLDVRPTVGRAFVGDDGGGPAFLLGDGFFHQRFAGNADLVGKALIQGGDNILIGVLPPDFRLYFPPEANVPGDVQLFRSFDPAFRGGKNYIIRVVARLRPGMKRDDAQRDFDRVAQEIRDAYAEFSGEDLRFTLTGMQEDAFRDIKPALGALFAGGVFVLLIACVNVTSLLLARASDRRKEIALRLAVGASRGRIVRQLLAEAGVLSLIGGAAGIGVGWAVFRGLAAIRPERLARIDEPGLMWPVLVSASAASLAAALLFALAPAFQSFRMDYVETLRSKGRGWLGRLQRVAGGGLVVGEITLAFMLVMGAALTARTLSKIEQIRPGFEPRQLLAFQLQGMPPTLLTEWEARFAALPGVTAAGAVSHLPLDTTVGNWYGEYRVQKAGRVLSYTADSRAVTPGYLQAMGIRLRAGRYFGPSDVAGDPFVVIVDESLAASTWPGESALGKTIEAEHMTPTGDPFALVPSVVVGVVEHVRTHSLTHEVRPQIYSPFEQNTRGGYPQTFVLRTEVPPLSLIPAVRTALRDRNPNAAIDKVRPMTDYIDQEIAPAGFTAVLAAVFGGSALLLAATGIYGVLNYQVSRRMPELGIRMALGASARNVLALILREGFTLALAGVLLGGLSAHAAAQWLASLLYGVSPGDPLSYTFALLVLPFAALLGCWRPAWRAACANPAETIREE